ncbi:RNA polymerase sigma factor [Rubripirellula tenax]|uniref:RNA polymerase sigma factor n=1 Tax=Rubripirellula tenax TaxID=2528015 RepID=A0A5C6E721_9BACT|nr:sigma-70 family RNA polymerase sigma factor [Rubripirellula tenax]TWU44752.1 RNA polymerase sigma factor [Rubripirellula tenax]
MTLEDPILTRGSLLLRIRSHEDQAAWSEFVEIYLPLIYAYARKQGLQDADASDVAQDVLTSINGAISRFDYDPKQGKFRGYLFTVTRNQIGKSWKKKVGSAGSGNTAVHQMLEQVADPAGDPADDEEHWNQQHQQRLMQWASEKVQAEVTPATWQAFELTSIANQKAQTVAETLGLSVGAVYIAKSRVIKRIRELIQSIEPDE